MTTTDVTESITIEETQVAADSSPSYLTGYSYGKQLPSITGDPLDIPETYDREQFVAGWKKAKKEVDQRISS